jgi:hypothetical protein
MGDVLGALVQFSSDFTVQDFRSVDGLAVEKWVAES